MSDIELVIKIPEKIYKYVQQIGSINMLDTQQVANVIFDGTPLPKGHGRLIDADALNIRMEQRMNEIGDDESIWESSNVETALDMFAPTIIEADKAES